MVGGVTYYFIEIAYRGYSHPSMFVLGAVCFVLLGLINEILSWDTPLWKQGLIGAVLITTLEFITGCTVNLWFGWDVWDYSNLPFNILGQVCPQFFAIWFVIAIIGIIYDDYLRYWIFKEEEPRYKLF